MEVFRISSGKHSRKLVASGRKARWNRDNQFTLYTGQYRSLSGLELVVHQNISSIIKYDMMVIHIADRESLYTKISIKDLPKNWKETSAYPALQDIGGDWYDNNKSLVLQVPSVIIPQEYNYILNLNHPDNKKQNLSLVEVEEFSWDDRLVIS